MPGGSFLWECLGFAYLALGLLALVWYQDRLSFPRYWDSILPRWFLSLPGRLLSLLFLAGWPVGIYLYVVPANSPRRRVVRPAERWVALGLVLLTLGIVGTTWYLVRAGR